MDKNIALQAAINGANYLANNVTSEGKFIYKRKIDGSIVDDGRYNVLRHCGCIWAMNNVNKIANIGNIEIATDKALIYLVQNIKLVNGYDIGLLNDNGKYKLGGNALAWLAVDSFIYSRQSYEDSKYLWWNSTKSNLFNGLFEFIDLCVPKITSYIIKKDTMKKTKFVSEYYPGEVALVLAHNDNYYNQTIKFIKQIELTRDNAICVQDHWLLQALEILHNKAGIKNDTEIMAYCIKYSSKIMQEIMKHIDEWRGRNTPLACRIEGMISHYKMTNDQYTLKWIEKLLEELLKFQNNKQNSLVYGVFVDNGISRIDYTQHAIMSLLRYFKLWSK